MMGEGFYAGSGKSKGEQAACRLAAVAAQPAADGLAAGYLCGNAGVFWPCDAVQRQLCHGVLPLQGGQLSLYSAAGGFCVCGLDRDVYCLPCGLPYFSPAGVAADGTDDRLADHRAVYAGAEPRKTLDYPAGRRQSAALRGGKVRRDRAVCAYHFGESQKNEDLFLRRASVSCDPCRHCGADDPGAASFRHDPDPWHRRPDDVCWRHGPYLVRPCNRGRYSRCGRRGGAVSRSGALRHEPH